MDYTNFWARITQIFEARIALIWVTNYKNYTNYTNWRTRITRIKKWQLMCFVLIILESQKVVFYV